LLQLLPAISELVSAANQTSGGMVAETDRRISALPDIL
jgi:hypothetical protein